MGLNNQPGPKVNMRTAGWSDSSLSEQLLVSQAGGLGGYSGWDPHCGLAGHLGPLDAGHFWVPETKASRWLFSLSTWYVCCATHSKVAGKARDTEALVRPKDGTLGRLETKLTSHSVPKMGMAKSFDWRGGPHANEGKFASIPA